MLAFLVLNYARVIKNCEVYAVYYGAFEVLGPVSVVAQIPLEQRNAPVFDLTQFIDLFDWTIGIDRYLNTGDASLIKSLTEKGVGALNRKIASKGEVAASDFRSSSLLKGLANRLKDYSDAVFTCRGKSLFKASSNLRTSIETVIEKSAHSHLKPLVPLMKKLYCRFESFDEDEYSNMLEVVKWCRDHRLYQQGLTILEEDLISYICDVLGMDRTDKNVRELVSQCVAIKAKNKPIEGWKDLAKSNSQMVEGIINSSKIDNRLWKLLYDIQGIRNDINHAGWNEHPCKPSTFEKKLNDFIKTAGDVI